MSSLESAQVIPEDIDSELAVKRLVQACMQAKLHVTNSAFFSIASIQDPHECFRQLCRLTDSNRLDIQAIIRSPNGKIEFK